MSTRVCFAILTLCYNLLTSAFYDGQEAPHRVQEVCQFTHFCQTDASQSKPNDTDKIPCCFPCYCDDDCWLFDDCCPDKDLMNGPRPPVVPCIDSYVKPRFEDSNPYEGFYKVIDTCPRYEKRSNLLHKCNRKNRTSLEDFVWVSDKTGRIYLNIYCAKCHGIQETKPWQIKTTCYDIMKANFGNFRETLLSENCNIINTVPEDLETVTDRYTCINPTKLRYPSCNETGLMASYDYDVEMACEQSTWPYVLGYSFAKNVLCVMCNQDIPTVNLDGLCNDAMELKDHVSFFTYLIDYASVSKNLPKEERNCGLDEMFDEFMRLCRKLVCPIGTAPFYGRCKQLVSKIYGPVIRVRYYLDVIQNQTSLFTDLEIGSIGEAVFSNFIELLDLNSNCKHCRKNIDIAENNSSSDFILTVTLEVKQGCHYDLVLKKLTDMRDKVVKAVFNRTTILTLSVRSDKQPSTSGPEPIFERNLDSCWVVYTLSFEDMTCPRIDLNYAELETFSHSDKKGKDAFASFFRGNGTEKSVTRVPVCLDTYISVMSKINSALPTYGKMTIQFLPALLYLLTIKS